MSISILRLASARSELSVSMTSFSSTICSPTSPLEELVKTS